MDFETLEKEIECLNKIKINANYKNRDDWICEELDLL